MKSLIAYFSAEGHTAKYATALSSVLNTDLFEITPEEPYSAADIKWTNPLSRCNREKFGKKEVPVASRIQQFDQYGFIFIGFPIWYGTAPNIINTFCKSYDWTGKKVAIFATSGGSEIGQTEEKLRPFLNNAVIADTKLADSESDLFAWAMELL